MFVVVVNRRARRHTRWLPTARWKISSIKPGRTSQGWRHEFYGEIIAKFSIVSFVLGKFDYARDIFYLFRAMYKKGHTFSYNYNNNKSSSNFPSFGENFTSCLLLKQCVSRKWIHFRYEHYLEGLKKYQNRELKLEAFSQLDTGSFRHLPKWRIQAWGLYHIRHYCRGSFRHLPKEHYRM